MDTLGGPPCTVDYAVISIKQSSTSNVKSAISGAVLALGPATLSIAIG